MGNPAWLWAGAAQLSTTQVRVIHGFFFSERESEHPARAALAAGPFTRPRRTAIELARPANGLPEPGGGEGPGHLDNPLPNHRQNLLFLRSRRQNPEYQDSDDTPPHESPVSVVRKWVLKISIVR